ncbi:MAG TPA: hypothetical protein DEO38_03975 [Bacteroidales bacterium]|nr:hypothetical protein [Bacteroidales bacterium]
MAKCVFISADILSFQQKMISLQDNMRNTVRQYHKLLFLLLVPVLLGSCLTAKHVNYFQPPGHGIASYADTLDFEDYAIRPGDKLYIRVYTTNEETYKVLNGFNGGSASYYYLMNNTGSSYGNQDLYTYRVDTAGCIRYPMIDTVKVVGLTTREAKHALEERLRSVINPVSVVVIISQRQFSVIGGAGTGRFFMQKEKVTIYEALAMAGNAQEYADRSKVRIIRTLPNGQTIVKKFDLRSADIINSEFYYIQPDDIIYIQMLNEQVFAMNSFAAVLSTIASTIGFGVFIYSFVNNYLVQPFKK